MSKRMPFVVSHEGEIEMSDVIYRLLAAELLEQIRQRENGQPYLAAPVSVEVGRPQGAGLKGE